MKKPIRILAVCVVFAVVANMAVAWTLAAFSDPAREQSLVPVAADHVWLDVFIDRQDGANWIVFSDRCPGVLGVTGLHRVEDGLNVPAESGYRAVAFDVWEPERQVILTGWPWLSLWSSAEISDLWDPRKLVANDTAWSGGIRLPEIWDRGVGVLPYHVRWRGMVANLVFYSLVASGIYAGWLICCAWVRCCVPRRAGNREES